VLAFREIVPPVSGSGGEFYGGNDGLGREGEEMNTFKEKELTQGGQQIRATRGESFRGTSFTTLGFSEVTWLSERIWDIQNDGWCSVRLLRLQKLNMCGSINYNAT